LQWQEAVLVGFQVSHIVGLLPGLYLMCCNCCKRPTLHSRSLLLYAAVVREGNSTVKDDEVNGVVKLADGSSIGIRVVFSGCGCEAS